MINSSVTFPLSLTYLLSLSCISYFPPFHLSLPSLSLTLTHPLISSYSSSSSCSSSSSSSSSEYLKSPRECVVLRDEDGSTELEGDWKRINTLHHYCVEDGAVFRLMRRRSPPPPGRCKLNFLILILISMHCVS